MLVIYCSFLLQIPLLAEDQTRIYKSKPCDRLQIQHVLRAILCLNQFTTRLSLMPAKIISKQLHCLIAIQSINFELSIRCIRGVRKCVLWLDFTIKNNTISMSVHYKTIFHVCQDNLGIVALFNCNPMHQFLLEARKNDQTRN